jgi:hypothetical protein
LEVSQLLFLPKLEVELQPVIAGGFGGNFQTLKVVFLQRLQQQPPGLSLPLHRIGKPTVHFQHLPFRAQQGNIRLVLAKINPHL